MFHCLDAHILFIHAPNEGHIGCFQVLALMSEAPLNIYVQVLFYEFDDVCTHTTTANKSKRFMNIFEYMNIYFYLHLYSYFYLYIDIWNLLLFPIFIHRSVSFKTYLASCNHHQYHDTAQITHSIKLPNASPLQLNIPHSISANQWSVFCCYIFASSRVTSKCNHAVCNLLRLNWHLYSNVFNISIK